MVIVQPLPKVVVDFLLGFVSGCSDVVIEVTAQVDPSFWEVGRPEAVEDRPTFIRRLIQHDY